MKAIVVHRYGGPEELTWEEHRDPIPGPDEVLVRVAATSVNPIDLMRRSGFAKALAPITFPGIVGVDLSGTVAKVGSRVKRFSVGDRVLGMADQTYAELCVARAANLIKIPDGLAPVEAAALPLVTVTGNQLISVGTDLQAGQRVLVTGAVGNVGRAAVFTAKERGAFVIAGVRRSQLGEGARLGANEAVAIDDDEAVAGLAPLDAIADAVDGETAQKLITKVRPGGVFGSVLGAPQNAGDYPAVKVVPVYAQPDATILRHMVQAVQKGSLIIPVVGTWPLKDAAEAHAAVAKGAAGKVLLVAQ